MKRNQGHPGSTEETASVMTPPKDLAAGAKKHWLKLAPVVVKIRPLTEADVTLFSMLCELLSELDSLKKRIARDGHILKSKRGSGRLHPGVGALLSTRAHAMRLMKTFGLAPTHRRKSEGGALGKVETPSAAGVNYFASLRRIRGKAEKGAEH